MEVPKQKKYFMNEATEMKLLTEMVKKKKIPVKREI